MGDSCEESGKLVPWDRAFESVEWGGMFSNGSQKSQNYELRVDLENGVGLLVGFFRM